MLILTIIGILILLLLVFVLGFFYWNTIPLRPKEEGVSYDKGFEYVHVEEDGSVRELDEEERNYLMEEFDPCDGARPYIKSSYKQKTPDDKIWGYILRRRVPKSIKIKKLLTILFISVIATGCENEISDDELINLANNMDNTAEDRYGINKDYAHPNAIKLVPEEFFWDCVDELAPFGSDEGDMALAEYRDWRKLNPNTPILECMKWSIEGVGEIPYENYNESLLSKEVIKEHIYNQEYNDHYYIYTLDATVIGTGFGQLVDEGKIDEDIKPTISIALTRLIYWSELQPDWEGSEIFIKNLKVLERILADS